MTRRVGIIVPVAFFLVVWTLTTHGKFSNSGDEPHYLMVAESLVSDGDLDVANNYRNGDGRWFGNETLEAGPHARTTLDGRIWSTHDVGLPIAVLPVYAAATRASILLPDSWLETIRQPRGLFAYSLVSLSLVVLTATGLGLLISAFSRHAPAARVALVVLVAGVSPPVLSHAFLVFPETIAFFVVCTVVWLAMLPANELTSRRVAFVVTSVGLMPWLHRKYSFLVFGLVFLLGSRHTGWLRRQRPSLLGLLAVLAVLPQALLHAWTVHEWGTVGGPQMVNTLPFAPANALAGGLGLLFDRERGLVAYAPVYLLAPVCWVLSWKEYRTWLVPITTLFVPMTAFSVWSAGFSPAARYLVPLVPLALAPVARALSYRAIRIVALGVVIFQACIIVVVWQYPRTLWPKEQGTNDALASIPWIGRAYERLLPSILTGDSIAWGVTALVALAAGSAALAWRARRAGVEGA
jgi:hypothetical protein